MKDTRARGAIAGLCLALSTGTALAAPVTLHVPASRDNTLFAEDVDASNGAGSHLNAGHVARGFERRALLAFDLGTAIPKGATLVSASLRLHVDLLGTPGDVSFSLHRLTAAWGEGSSDNGGLGQGAAATPGDATWRTAVLGTPGAEWRTPGGDFISAASASAIVADVGYATWHSGADPTAGLLADIDMWRAAPHQNHGWLLKEDSSLRRSVRRFASRSSDNAEHVPMLTVTYEPAPAHVPSPSAGALLLTLASVALVSRGRPRRGCIPPAGSRTPALPVTD